MRRAGAITLAVAVGATGGCGGGDDEAAQEPPAATGAPPATTPYEVPAQPKTRAKRRTREAAANRRGPLVRSVAESQLRLVGLEDSAIATDKRARDVTVTISEASACGARARDAERFADALKHALPFVREVDVRVYGYRGSMREYRKDRCRRASRPSGGPVLRASGSQSTTTAPFTVRTGRWTLSYTSAEGVFRLRVLRNGRLVRQIGQPPSGSGSRTLTGSGVYRIRIEADGKWSVTARELP